MEALRNLRAELQQHKTENVQRKSKSEERYKQHLLNRVVDAQRELVGTYLGKTIPSDSVDAQNLCGALENIFIHGIKVEVNVRFKEFLHGLGTRNKPHDEEHAPSPAPSFWNVVKPLSPKFILDEIHNNPTLASDVARCRAWVRIMLNNKLFDNQLKMILDYKSVVRSNYGDEAFLADEEKSRTLEILVRGLVELNFELPLVPDHANEWPEIPAMSNAPTPTPTQMQPHRPATFTTANLHSQSLGAAGTTTTTSPSNTALTRARSPQPPAHKSAGVSISPVIASCSAPAPQPQPDASSLTRTVSAGVVQAASQSRSHASSPVSKLGAAFLEADEAVVAQLSELQVDCVDPYAEDISHPQMYCPATSKPSDSSDLSLEVIRKVPKKKKKVSVPQVTLSTENSIEQTPADEVKQKHKRPKSKVVVAHEAISPIPREESDISAAPSEVERFKTPTAQMEAEQPVVEHATPPTAAAATAAVVIEEPVSLPIPIASKSSVVQPTANPDEDYGAVIQSYLAQPVKSPTPQLMTIRSAATAVSIPAVGDVPVVEPPIVEPSTAIVESLPLLTPKESVQEIVKPEPICFDSSHPAKSPSPVPAPVAAHEKEFIPIHEESPIQADTADDEPAPKEEEEVTFETTSLSEPVNDQLASEDVNVDAHHSPAPSTSSQSSVAKQSEAAAQNDLSTAGARGARSVFSKMGNVFVTAGQSVYSAGAGVVKSSGGLLQSMFTGGASQPTAEKHSVASFLEEEAGLEDFTLLGEDGHVSIDFNDETILPFVSRLLDICPEKGMDSQDYKCAACDRMIGFVFGEARVCDYTGKYYCTECHKNEMSVIPGRIMHNWDFNLRPVCCDVKKFLDSIREQPLLHVHEVNPKLYGLDDELNGVRKLRRQLCQLREYIFTCKPSAQTKLRRSLWPREYLMESEHTYSIQDLKDVNDGSLARLLRSIANDCVSHVISCDTCREKGFVCEVCHAKDVIYPFDIAHTVRCERCLNVYHIRCYKSETCPKCARIEKRQKSAATTAAADFYNGD